MTLSCVALIAAQLWLYTGLFIVAHDTMHGSFAPGNDAAIGGLKVQTENAWFAARPSGTEDVYKIYAESFLGADHLATVQAEAKQLVDDVLR